MDSSPLVKAHDHARAAAVATRQAQQATTSDTTVAISEHTHAAGEFANAARSTTSLEALRTLKLLEEHHRRLAEILKLPPEPTSQTGDDEEETGEKASVQDEKGESATGQQSTSRREPHGSKGAQMPSLAQQRRIAAREMSSSIASNLASARGIRSKYREQPLSPSVSNDQAPGNVDPHPRRDGSKAKMQDIIDHQTGTPTWVPPMSAPRKQEMRSKGVPSPRAEVPSAASTEDAGYARFYNTFGNLINKISAPLAFAGLPLIQEEPGSEEAREPTEARSASPTSAKRKAPRPPPSSLSLDPDLSKIYSKATMRALAREGHSASDSFYVVPTSGHTMSYANILTYAEKEKRRLEASAHSDLAPPAEEDEEDFVDARETLVPLSPGARRRAARSQSHTEKGLRNTIEELSMENKSLKDMLDNVSKRLHAFEASSQHSAMALAESYRVMRPGSPTATHASGKAAMDDALRKKALDMEEQLGAAVKQMERLEKDNRKMQKTLDKYREKWDMLKAGAKARREAQAGESVEDARQS
ncbi:hypothetical protein JDV02_007873 [Purpureocillium takamizusanense]|uniref:Uncharacterized protein n=1 Tax=Purpureocillium takamizusanense TaxID=2060973 RepID=A0A9Q8QNH1_9HYPO|nr:uncharacterized protein JDV02_007873 [Purpureocillium takamizusanense]UNI21929.1 hypothetical protein JDV02_007873 [Purpureocillium takamizusanense]